VNLHLPLPRRTRVLSIQCGLCRQWRKPRHIRVPAMVCRDCETTPAFQSWKPTAPSATTPIPTLAGGPR
jgi:hypothetical protein